MGSGFVIIFNSTGIFQILGILFVWWSTAGAIMLSLDYPNRLRSFRRLLGLAGKQEGLGRAKQCFTDTLCGWCIIFAVSRRLKARG